MIRLNVIGQDEKRAINDLLRAHALLLSLFAALGICAVTIVLLLIGRSYFNIRLTSAKDELSSTKIVSPAGKTLPVLELTTKMNAELAVLGPQTIDYQFDTILLDLGLHTPTGVTFTMIALASKDNTLTAQGYAASRNDVPLLESNLKGLPYLTNVTIQSSLNERTHVPLSIKATVDRTKFITK